LILPHLSIGDRGYVDGRKGRREEREEQNRKGRGVARQTR